MAIYANRTFTDLLSPPGGWPVRLRPGQTTIIWGVADKTATQVTAKAAASKTATVTLALYNTPATAGGSDNGLVVDLDTDGITILKSYSTSVAITNANTEITLDLPSIESHIAKPYVVRLTVSDVTGDVSDTVIRDAAITDATTQPRVPGFVDVTEMRVL